MTDEKKAIRKNLSRQAIYEITHCRAVYIMAFIVPLIIMLAIYIMRGIYPFGDSVYLRSDMYHQYAPFFSNLWDKIRNGGSLQYSWDIGMGSNFLALYGYYLSSPINWFIALFPKKNLLEIMDYIIMIKIALSSFTFTYYLCKHRGKISITAAIFGLFYALSGFTTAYSWNIMWLDSVVLLPLIVLGLERLVKEHKGLLYTITLGLAILSNYYIAIMICISMVIYFFVLIISENLGNKKNYMKSIFCFIGYSLLAGGVASVLLLPEMAALQYTASSDFSFPKVMTRYFSFFAMFKRHLINVDVHLGLEHHPNIYCGVASFVLVPLFVMSKKISKKEKITKMIALFIFLTAFNMNIPNFIWHGFHFPNSLPCRQSFIYVFLILEICYEAAVNIRDYSEKQLAGSMWDVLLFLMYIGNSLGDKDIDFRSIYLSGIFIVIYVLFFFFIKKWKQYTSYFLVAIFAIAIVEVTMNTEKTGYGTTVRSAYLKDYEGVSTVINDVEKNDTSFYRIHKYKGYRSKNDATWNNFHSTSTFSSTAYAGLTSFYGSLGLEHSTNAYALNGATPLIYSILNVKYLLTNEHMPDNDIFTYYSGNDGEFLYKNEYALPLAYMVPGDIDENLLYTVETNPFNVQNNFIYHATGIDNVMTPISYDENGTKVTITPDKNMFVYVYVQNKNIETIYGYINSDSYNFTGVNHGRTLDIGYVEAGSTISLTPSDSEKGSLRPLVYAVDEDKFKEAMTKLSAGGLNVTSYSDTRITGTITADKSGLMFTSIPYDKSWTVYVDGTPVSTQKVGDAFLAVELSAGTHTIEMKFTAGNYKAGLVISIISFIIIGSLVFFRIKFKTEITEENAIETMIYKINSKNKKTDKKQESEETEQ